MSLSCGCEPCYEGGYGDDGTHGRYSMEWCPLHKNASEMYKALKDFMLYTPGRTALDKRLAARALLREIESITNALP